MSLSSLPLRFPNGFWAAVAVEPYPWSPSHFQRGMLRPWVDPQRSGGRGTSLSWSPRRIDDGGLLTIGIGIRGRATECLTPVSGESLDMLRVEAVAERRGDHVVGHHPTMPGVCKRAQAVVAARRLENTLHAV